MALSAGAILCVASRQDLIPGEPLLATLRRQRITHATLPPIAVSSLPSGNGLETLGTLVVAGEVCPSSLARQWLPGRRFINAYGPTETTVCASIHACDSQSTAGAAPIGRPILNTQIYILDSQRKPVPIGVTGEIYIGGMGVARGYLNRPELTAERFVDDPFSEDPRAGDSLADRSVTQARLYKTGDMGRWRADGNLEYLGRNDHQVKIRGYRIELGEIESQLSRHAHVKDAVVLAREGLSGEKRLVAYVTRAIPGELQVEDLRHHLKAVLPDYMVPGAYVVLESLPLTPNGKVDRKALPAPELDAYGIKEYEAPQGETEETLAGIWQELLQVERVGRQDNFFELGGHSLLAVQMIVQVRGALGFELHLKTLFERPTVELLGESIDILRWATAPASFSHPAEMDEGRQRGFL
jgi:acyl-CoA synthetase (AMP-forming)/AMP-acid ligase II